MCGFYNKVSTAIFQPENTAVIECRHYNKLEKKSLNNFPFTVVSISLDYFADFVVAEFSQHYSSPTISNITANSEEYSLSLRLQGEAGYNYSSGN